MPPSQADSVDTPTVAAAPALTSKLPNLGSGPLPRHQVPRYGSPLNIGPSGLCMAAARRGRPSSPYTPACSHSGTRVCTKSSAGARLANSSWIWRAKVLQG